MMTKYFQHRPNVITGVKKVCSAVAASASLLIASGGTVAAQTDYYNLDAGRPVLSEDAYPVEFRAFELQAAPLRLERASGGQYHWSVEPELAWGVLPRLQIEVGFPTVYLDTDADTRKFGLAGIDASFLYNLNAETETLPGMAVAGDIALPVGGFAHASAYPSLKAIMTRTYSFARIHLNGRYTFGSAPGVGDEIGVEELSRWVGSVAVDKTFPLKSMLFVGEVYARQPIESDRDVEWNAAAGIRYQLTPRLALDAGLGKVLVGEENSWHLTFGTAYAFAVRSLMPGT